MILCLRCKRVWAKGSVFCGSCGGALGKRICPDGHESHITAKFCTVCGSPKLSKGSPSLDLRLVSWCVLASTVWFAFSLAGPALGKLLYIDGTRIFARLLDVVIGLAVWSWLIGLVLGESTRRIMFSLWMGAANLLIRTLERVVQLILHLVTKNLIR